MFESLGNVLRLRRVQLNLSQERAADLAGMSRQQVAQMEKGENMTLVYLVRLANALELTELPLDGLRLRPVKPELGVVVLAADTVDMARRAITQAASAGELLDEASKTLDILMDRALAPAGSTRAIADALRRLEATPAADRERIGQALRELAEPDRIRRKRSAATPAARKRAR